MLEEWSIGKHEISSGKLGYRTKNKTFTTQSTKFFLKNPLLQYSSTPIKMSMGLPLFHHPDPTTIRTYPCGPIGHTPFILLQTGIAYLEPTRATPAKWQFHIATVAFEFFFLTTAAWFVLFFFRLHWTIGVIVYSFLLVEVCF